MIPREALYHSGGFTLLQASENDSLFISRTHALELGKPVRTISKASEDAITRKSSDRKKYTFEEIIQIIEEKIQVTHILYFI